MNYYLTQSYSSYLSPKNPDGCEGKLAHAFYDLMRQVWDVRFNPLHTSSWLSCLCFQTESNSANPRGFRHVLSEFYPLFEDNEQHDATELTEAVLDGLMEDCNAASDPKPYVSEVTFRRVLFSMHDPDER